MLSLVLGHLHGPHRNPLRPPRESRSHMKRSTKQNACSMAEVQPKQLAALYISGLKARKTLNPKP